LIGRILMNSPEALVPPFKQRNAYVMIRGMLPALLLALFLCSFQITPGVKSERLPSVEKADPAGAETDHRVSVELSPGTGRKWELVRTSATPTTLSNELGRALSQGRAEPLNLASADFDEDGRADLIGGYRFEGRGIIAEWRGNASLRSGTSKPTTWARGESAFTALAA